MAWAASAPRSARAGSSRNARRASPAAGSSAAGPKRAAVTTWRVGRGMGPEDPRHQPRRVPRQWADQAPPRGPVAPQPGGRLRDGTVEQHGAIGGQDVRRGHLRMRQLDAERREVERAEERRDERRRDDRGARVVDEPRKRQLGRPEAAAGGRRALVDADREPGAGHRDGRRQPVRPAADDDRVERAVGEGHGLRILAAAAVHPDARR